MCSDNSHVEHTTSDKDVGFLFWLCHNVVSQKPSGQSEHSRHPTGPVIRLTWRSRAKPNNPVTRELLATHNSFLPAKLLPQLTHEAVAFGHSGAFELTAASEITICSPAVGKSTSRWSTQLCVGQVLPWSPAHPLRSFHSRATPAQQAQHRSQESPLESIHRTQGGTTLPLDQRPASTSSVISCKSKRLHHKDADEKDGRMRWCVCFTTECGDGMQLGCLLGQLM